MGLENKKPKTPNLIGKTLEEATVLLKGTKYKKIQEVSEASSHLWTATNLEDPIIYVVFEKEIISKVLTTLT